MQKNNLLSKKFGTLTVIAEAGSNKDGRILWTCKCDCGQERVTSGKSLISSKTTGCIKRCTKVQDLSGQTFGYWFVMRRIEPDKHGFARFLCKCKNLVSGSNQNINTECGFESAVNGIALRSGVSRSCQKCAHILAGQKTYDENTIDLSGQTFGRLLVLGPIVQQVSRRRFWKCRCSCEAKTISIVRQDALLGEGKSTKSCGCLTVEAAKNNTTGLIHGLSDHPLHYIWLQIKARCESNKSAAHHRYGGRGIKLCPEWQDFKVFYIWALENGWKKGLHIDRINNDGDYSPNNCQIITRLANVLKMQRDKGRASFFNGKQININDLSKETNVPHQSCMRLISAGYSPSDVRLYGKLEFFQRQHVGKSIKANNLLSMQDAAKIKRVIIDPRKQASELGSYRAMISRCYNKKDPSFKNYGAKNIPVCKEWRKSYKQFLLDMGPKPEPKNQYSIHRIDSSKGYYPENCIWVTNSENTKMMNASRREKKLNQSYQLKENHA